jgi:hypothetical protein
MGKYKNTLQKGSVRYIVFKEADTWYAVGLEFNIIEEGDDPQIALFNLFEAIRGYVKSCGKAKIRPHILNQQTDKEYENLWTKITSKEKSLIKSPYSVYTFGERQLNFM